MKNQKGITLIALVITIIVLLILAGITIAMLTGDNGLLTRSQQAAKDNALGGVKDKVAMAIQDGMTDYLATYYAGDATARGTSAVTVVNEKIQNLDQDSQTAGIQVDGCTVEINASSIVITNDTRKCTITTSTSAGSASTVGYYNVTGTSMGVNSAS